MIEPYVSDKQCRTCCLPKLATEFSEGRNDCKQCRREGSRGAVRKAQSPRVVRDGPFAWHAPSDPRTLDQQLHALRQQKWCYPVEATCNLRAVL